jgi:hypothetical protein
MTIKKMVPTKKKPLRRTEVFIYAEFSSEFGFDNDCTADWKSIKFTSLKRGDIFRCFDTMADGTEKPDQVDKKGNHVVYVAVEDAKEKSMPELGVVECIPVRGFNKGRV